MDMNEVFGNLIGYGIPFGVVLVALLVLIVAMGAAVSWTRYIVFLYVIAVLCDSGSYCCAIK
jgi:hypothetical protein